MGTVSSEIFSRVLRMFQRKQMHKFARSLDIGAASYAEILAYF
jgi:hypothetical protein